MQKAAWGSFVFGQVKSIQLLGTEQCINSMASVSNPCQRVGCMGNIPYADLLSIVKRETEKFILCREIPSKELLRIRKDKREDISGQSL